MIRLVDFLLNFYGSTLYLIVFGILVFCGVGIPIPEDITLLAVGLMVYYGLMQFSSAMAVCLTGVLLGDSLMFFLGAKYGRKLTKRWLFHKLLPDDRLDAVRRKFNERGDKLLFAARFMPGFRAPIFFSAGLLHVPFKRFIVYDGAAALISVPTIMGLVYIFGDNLDAVIRWIRRVEHGILFVIAGILVLVVAKWYLTHRKLRRG